MELLEFIEHTEFSTWLRESDWGYPIMLCFHAVGMGMVVGISLMFSARVLGYSKGVPLAAFDRLFKIAWYGFALNAVSGVLLFVGEPRRLLVTLAFQIKMILIVCAGLSLWAIGKVLGALSTNAGPEGAVSGAEIVTPAAKLIAVLTIIFWLGAILAGRLIGYTIGPPPV
jgi:hypothetical protein